MKRFHLAVALVACCLSSAALAVGTTYNFGSPIAGNTAYNANSAGGSLGGTNYGNALQFAGTGGPANNVTISAWGTNGYGAGLQTAYLNNSYTCCNPPPVQTELAITSQSTVNSSGNSATGSGNTANTELVGWAPNTGNGEHAIDNKGGDEALFLSFANKVTLTGLSAGWVGSDADATVLEYTLGNDPTASIAGKSFTQLLASGWKIVSNASLAYDSSTNLSLSGATASKYWMVGAYLANVGTNGAGDNGTTSFDAFKLTGFVAAQAVPEPGSIALIGIAGLALAASRRRARKA